jgi:hypothetical protein
VTGSLSGLSRRRPGALTGRLRLTGNLHLKGSESGSDRESAAPRRAPPDVRVTVTRRVDFGIILA